jgi:hypothetical protein
MTALPLGAGCGSVMSTYRRITPSPANSVKSDPAPSAPSWSEAREEVCSVNADDPSSSPLEATCSLSCPFSVHFVSVSVSRMSIRQYSFQATA